MKANKQARTGVLIEMLNPIIRGWGFYHRNVASSATFRKMDSAIFNCLWRWKPEDIPTNLRCGLSDTPNSRRRKIEDAARPHQRSRTRIPGSKSIADSAVLRRCNRNRQPALTSLVRLWEPTACSVRAAHGQTQTDRKLSKTMKMTDSGLPQRSSVLTAESHIQGHAESCVKQLCERSKSFGSTSANRTSH